MAEPIVQRHPQCEAEHPKTGTRCGQPAGHKCSHGNGTLCQAWEDDPLPVQPPELYGE